MYVIRSMKMAGWLMQQGFRLMKLELDKGNPAYNVFLFEHTNELLKAMTEYGKISK